MRLMSRRCHEGITKVTDKHTRSIRLGYAEWVEVPRSGMAKIWKLPVSICLCVLAVGEMSSVRQSNNPFYTSNHDVCLVSDSSSPSILGRVAHRVYSRKDDKIARIYVSVRTTVTYHDERLAAIMLTWMQSVSPPSLVSRVHCTRYKWKLR